MKVMTIVFKVLSGVMMTWWVLTLLGVWFAFFVPFMKFWQTVTPVCGYWFWSLTPVILFLTGIGLILCLGVKFFEALRDMEYKPRPKNPAAPEVKEIEI